MKNRIIIVSLVSFFIGSANLMGSTQTLSEVGYKAINETWNELKFAGLLEMDPWDPRLPRPQVPALKAVVSQRVGLLAYFNEEYYGGGTTLVFKSPNGGQRHSVSFNQHWIGFLTPYQGTIAHANRFMTVNGPGYNFYCQSQPVTEFAFYQCIDSLFIKVIVNQLKPYSN